MRRTPTIEHDGTETFEVLGNVTKAWTDRKSGQRFLRGVVSGVAEDADGERCSARAIAKMAATALAGGTVKATASHDQDWLTEFGDVVKLSHDAEHNELAVDVALPPPGEDPIADKAYRTALKRKLGWSIGGKLRKSFFEVVDGEVGKGGGLKRRHVLDDIDLRHVMLTQKPSYRQSFAQAVAKTAKLDDAPRFDDSEFYEEPDSVEATEATEILKRAGDQLAALAVAKAKTPPADDDEPEDGKDPSAEADEPAADADPDTDADVPTPGAGDTTPEAPTDAEAAQKLPKAEGARHLACPNCGTEFAAPLPDDLAANAIAEKHDDDDKPSADTAKTTTKETTMGTPLTESLAAIRALATGGAPEVEKTITPEAEVEKTITPEPGAEATDVEKMIAASHRLSIEATEELGGTVAKALGDLSESVQKIADRLDEEPTGRRSVAKSRGGLGDPKPVVGDPAEESTIAKVADDANVNDLSREQLLTLSHDDIVKRAPDTQTAMKALNKRDRGVE